MTNLRGPGAMTDVNLIARTFNNSTTKDGKESQYLDVQVDARDPRGKGQTNLHLISERTEFEGKARYNNSAPYTKKQFDAIKEAAGDNLTPIVNKDGEEIGTMYAVKASVMPAGTGKGLVINTSKPMTTSEFKVDGKTMTGQMESVKEAKAAKAAAKEAAAPAPEAEQQVEQAAELEPSV